MFIIFQYLITTHQCTKLFDKELEEFSAMLISIGKMFNSFIDS